MFFLENLVSANVKKNKNVDEAIKQLKKTVLYDCDVQVCELFNVVLARRVNKTLTVTTQ